MNKSFKTYLACGLVASFLWDDLCILIQKMVTNCTFLRL